MPNTFTSLLKEVNLLFVLLLSCELIDFCFFDSSPISSIIIGFGLFFLFVKRNKFKFNFRIVVFLIPLVSLFENGSFFRDTLKTITFSLALFFVVISSGIVKLRLPVGEQETLSQLFYGIGSSLERFLIKILPLLFIFLSIDSFCYFHLGTMFIVNPNSLGLISATYLAALLLIPKEKKVLFTGWNATSILFLSGFMALIASDSKGAFFIIFFPSLLFTFSNRLKIRFDLILNFFVVLFVVGLFLLYSDIDQSYDLIESLIQIKQNYLGGSLASSDLQRLYEIPSLVINYIISTEQYVFGGGVFVENPDSDIYNAVIPHSMFFLLISYIGILGLIFYLSVIFYGILKSKGNVRVFFILVYLLFGISGSIQISRGLLFPFTLMIIVLKLKHFFKIARKRQNETLMPSRNLGAP